MDDAPGQEIPTKNPELKHDIAAWILTAVALIYVLAAHLLPALLGGLLVYELVHILAPKFKLKRLSGRRGKVLAVALLAIVVTLVVTVLIMLGVAFFRGEAGRLPALLKKMAEILESSRDLLPAWAAAYLPPDADALQHEVVDWLRTHARELQLFGKDVGRALIYILIGMVIGAMVALHEISPHQEPKLLSRALTDRAIRLGNAFRRVVFAQVRISAINTIFTGLYLGLVLPLFDVHLPFIKTLLVITFIAGLLPVLGNLISNTVIVIVSLSHSLYVALGSLAFLVIIHKLEYFLNARIIGFQIRSRAWEILVAMLAMEAVFGIPGVIAAPIYYAYIKDELSSRKLI